MIMWVLSDRAIPRSYRMMEGFGVHTCRFINKAGKASLADDPDALQFLNEAHKHCKAIAADSEAIEVLQATFFGKK